MARTKVRVSTISPLWCLGTQVLDPDGQLCLEANLVFGLAVILKNFPVEDSSDDRFLLGIVGTGFFLIIRQLEKLIEIIKGKP